MIDAPVAAVLIGRNEGARLEESLASLVRESRPFVYVDSGSSDGSAELARAYATQVIELEDSRPFTAARARNAGFAAVRATWPRAEFVQFLDADCEIQPGWLDSAYAVLEANPSIAVITGHLAERFPEASIYHRLCAQEWRSPVGPVTDYGNLGGNMMVRASTFEELGGFNENVSAGEDSELGVRVGLVGSKVTKIDVSMAVHDARMLRFGQWWRRSCRAGLAIAQRAELNAASPQRDCVRERRSTLFWGLAMPIVIVGTLAPSGGGSSLFLGAYLLLGWRIFRFHRRAGESASDSLFGAGFGLLAKFANAIGLLSYYHHRARSRSSPAGVVG